MSNGGVHQSHCLANPIFPCQREGPTNLIARPNPHIHVKGRGPLISLLDQTPISMSKGGVHRSHCSVKPQYPCQMEGSINLTARSNLHIHVEGRDPPISLLGQTSISMSKGGIHRYHCSVKPPYPCQREGSTDLTARSNLHIHVKGRDPPISLLGQTSISMSKGGAHRSHCSVKPPYPCQREGSTDLTARSNLHIHVKGRGPPISLLGQTSISMSKGGIHRYHCSVKPPYPCRREGSTDITARSNLHIHVKGRDPPISLLGQTSISMSKGGIHLPQSIFNHRCLNINSGTLSIESMLIKMIHVKTCSVKTTG